MTETGNENIRRIEEIKAGKTALGIEFGSTRIKAVLIGSDHKPIASGGHDWENQLESLACRMLTQSWRRTSPILME